MPFTTNYPWRKRLGAVLIAFFILLTVEISLWFQTVQASELSEAADCCRPTLVYLTPRPTGQVPRVCGKLVYLVNRETGVGDIGLIPCSGNSRPLIFKVHPRDMVPYYQFRDVVIKKGDQICTDQYGCMDQYITSFKNYIGIDSCAACGMNIPPTWTQAPLTPYTPTPRPPTSTPYIPSPTPTDTATLAPYQMTATPDLFELLRGTPSPTALASSTAPATELPAPTPTQAPAPSIGFPQSSPLVLGIGFILIMLGLAYFAWLFVTRERE